MPIATTAYAIACVFGAAIVRGYAGFGFSLLAVTAISLVLPPATVVPSIFLMEIAASLHLLPSVWREVHWRAIGLLLLGCLAATPWGVWLLATAPAAPMQVALGAVVLVAAVLLSRGYALRAMPGRAATVTTGAASGLLNGAFGVGGPPVVLFFFASPAGAAAGRASVIAYFLGTDTIGLAFMLRQGLVGREQLALALVFLPALAAGVWIDARRFGDRALTDPASPAGTPRPRGFWRQRRCGQSQRERRKAAPWACCPAFGAQFSPWRAASTEAARVTDLFRLSRKQR